MKSGFLSIELENLNNCLKRTWIEEGQKRTEERTERRKEVWRG